jgi:hypothetical protein
MGRSRLVSRILERLFDIKKKLDSGLRRNDTIFVMPLQNGIQKKNLDSRLRTLKGIFDGNDKR